MLDGRTLRAGEVGHEGRGVDGSARGADLRAHGREVGPVHSHSMVPGGLDVTSSTTRLTPSTSLMSRLAIRSTRS